MVGAGAHRGARFGAIGLRWLLAGLVFVAVGLTLVATVGNFADADTAANSFPLVICLALAGGVVTFGVVEFAQTGRVATLERQLGTSVLTLIPAAIAINIVVGSVVGSVLKVPLYLDSLGTILVGVLGGPFAGALTGVMTNLLWTYVAPPPFQGGPAAAFSLTAATIGVIAGIGARWGFMRERPAASVPRLLASGAVATLTLLGLATFSFFRFYVDSLAVFASDAVSPARLVLGWAVLAILIAAVVGLFAMLVLRRDQGVAFVVVLGALTGFIAGTLSAPVAASLFGGVTGGGTDFLVAYFRGQGASVLAASFQQSLISDPIDKTAEFLLVYLALQSASPRAIGRFPQAPHLLPRR